MTTYNIPEDLRKCSQIAISFENGRECLIRKIRENTFCVEMENPHNEYPYMSAESVLRMLPCCGISTYTVSVLGELTDSRALFAKSLFPRLCSPVVRLVKMESKVGSVLACKLADGNWMMCGVTCSIVEVVHAMKKCLDTPLDIYFSINDKEPVKI